MEDLVKEQRFWMKVEKTETCWIWLGCRNQLGYGTFRGYGKNIPAHRFAYCLHKGEIPHGLVIDHLCRNPSCVNPGHLEAVTHRENVMRGRVSALKSNTCRKGHEFTQENSHYKSDGHRSCRTCERARWRNRYLMHQTKFIEASRRRRAEATRRRLKEAA